MNNFPRIQPLGDSAAVIELGDRIALDINRRVSALTARLRDQSIAGVVEILPTYAAITIYYDPLIATYARIEHWLRSTAEPMPEGIEIRSRVIDIPTIYGGAYGPDLEFVAAYHRITPEAVIQIHTERPYRVFMLGFTPGFPYLGELDSRLETPRLDTPRRRVPPGSVGIAGNQTGIYPIESPGGWRIIGRTMRNLFDPHREPPFMVAAGDTVRFVRSEYLHESRD